VDHVSEGVREWGREGGGACMHLLGVYVCMCVCVCVYVYICVCVYVCICVYMCVFVVSV
jgi:hypothetical protein